MLPRSIQRSITILTLAFTLFLPLRPVLSTSAFTVTSAPDINLDPVARLGGSITSVEVSGNVAYIGQGGTFVVLDIHDPAHMTRLAALNVPDFIHQIRLVGSLAYLAGGNGGLRIIDVSSPTTPQLIGSYSSEGSIEDLEVSNGYAYVIESTPACRSLRILNISDPEAPYLAGSYSNTSGCFERIAVADEMVYLTGMSGRLMILDADDPTTPVLQSVTRIGSYSFSDVQVIGELAFISGSGGVSGESLAIYDVSNPVEPTMISETYDYSYEENGEHRLAIKGSLAFVVSPLKLSIFDFTNPQNPIAVNVYYEWSGQDLRVVDSQVFLAEGDLKVLDFSSLDNPILLGSYYLCGYVNDAKVVNSYLYIADSYQRLQILNIANPADPYYISALPEYGHNLKVIGNLLYLNAFNNGFEIWDIADPQNPVLLSLYNPLLHGSYVTMTLDGNYAYITELLGGTRGTGLNIIDIHDAANPVFKGVVDNIPDWPAESEVVGNLVYIADNSGGLVIVDVSNVTQPKIIGQYQGLYAHNVEIIGNVAYVTDRSEGLVMLDISNPVNPVLINSYLPENTRAGVVRVVDGLAYLSDYYNGLLLVDISNPLQPELLQRVSMPGYISDIEVAGEYIYVASSTGGVNIFQQSNGNEAPVEIHLSASIVEENQPANTHVGTLSTTNSDANSSVTYSLVNTISCPGADNDAFDISGTTLRTAVSFNFEGKSSYSVCVRALNVDELSVDQAFTINVTNVNEAPTDLFLSGASVREKQPINTVVGSFSSTDPDSGETFSYSLVNTENCPGTDNADFNLWNNTLRTSAIFDSLIQSSYTLCIRTTDQGGLSLDRPFTIPVTTTIYLPFITVQ